MLLQYIGKLLHWKPIEGATLRPVTSKFTRGISSAAHGPEEGYEVGEILPGQVLQISEDGELIGGEASGGAKPTHTISQKIVLSGVDTGYLLGVVPAGEAVSLRAQVDAGSAEISIEICGPDDAFATADVFASGIVGHSGGIVGALHLTDFDDPAIAAGSWVWVIINDIDSAHVLVVALETQPA